MSYDSYMKGDIWPSARRTHEQDAQGSIAEGDSQLEEIVCAASNTLFIDFGLHLDFDLGFDLRLQFDDGGPQRVVNTDFLTNYFKCDGERVACRRVGVTAPTLVSADREARAWRTAHDWKTTESPDLDTAMSMESEAPERISKSVTGVTPSFAAVSTKLRSPTYSLSTSPGWGGRYIRVTFCGLQFHRNFDLNLASTTK